jgi:hypothetical protein
MVARLLACLACCVTAGAVSYPTEVVAVHYGPGAGFGQAFFPTNVLGPPDSAASPQQPCADPAELLALGTEGWIVLHFATGIVDGPGPDFSIYENVLQYGVDPPLYFREAGIVALSEDGETWTELPFDPPSGQGLAGWWPTHGDAIEPDWQTGGGDPMDLAWAGLSRASYLRISDAGARVADQGGSFDLDAVRVWHDESLDLGGLRRQPTLELRAWPNPFNGRLRLHRGIAAPGQLRIFDLMGRTLLSRPVQGHELRIDATGLPSGLLLIEIDGGPAGRAQTRVLHLR